MPRLQVLNGKRQGAIFEIEPHKEMVIGHRQSAQITIDDPWVSWDHAKVIFDTSDATCWIEDMNSTNGTFVNCERVKREQLRHEDIVFLGKTHVIFLSPVEEHSHAIFEHSSPSTANAPQAPALTTPPGGLHVSSAQGFMASSGGDTLGQSSPGGAQGWGTSGSRTQSDPFEDSSVDPFSSDPAHEEDDLDWNRPAARNSSNLAGTRPESDASASQPRLNLSEIQSDADLNLPQPSAREIASLISDSESFDDLNDILGDGRAVTPPPAQIPTDFRDLSAQDLGEARTLPLPEPRPSARHKASVASTQPMRQHSPPPPPPPAATTFDPSPPNGEVPGDIKTLAFERARLEDEVRRLRGALDAANKATPEQIRIAANALRDQELGRLARRVADLEGQVAELKQTVREREEELDTVTEDMIQKEDELDTLSQQLRRSQTFKAAPAPAPAPSPAPMPQSTFDVGNEDFRSLEF